MVGRRGNTTSPNVQEKKDDGERKKISEYEQSRKERIEQNLQRMQNLGIFDLSLKLKSVKPIPRPKKTFSPSKNSVDSSAFPPSAPPRRSSRLQNATPVSYSEVDLTKKDEKLKGQFWREEGSRPEVYTEEHEKLLGSTEMSWTFFVDGYDKDGKRIYDPVNGKTCHQCRQKTLGQRTRCSKCDMVQGQFCGDCLYVRYGEHVLEANQNPNWICPVCRGICNCSLCRQSKGWPPTGPLYRKISGLGFKSVAHYLIQTRRAETETGKAVSPTSVIISEPSSHIDSSSGEEVVVEFNTTGGSTSSDHGGKKSDDNADATKEKEENKSSDEDQVASKIKKENADPPESPKLSFDKSGSPRSEIGHESEGNKDSKSPQLADKHFNRSLAPESSPNPRKTSVHTSEPGGDSIGRRLRQRRRSDICLEEQKSVRGKDIFVHAVELENVSSQLSLETSVDAPQPMVADAGSLKQMGSEEGKEEQLLSVEKKTGTLDFLQRKKPNIVSVPGKQEAIRTQSSFNNKEAVAITSLNPKRKRTNMKEVDPDSIGGRLRQRRCRSISK